MNRTHRFFDSKGPGGVPSPQPDGGHHRNTSHGGKNLTFNRKQHKLFAHNGYIYSMILVRGLIEQDPQREVLITGAGDSIVKLWSLDKERDGEPVEICALENDTTAVLALGVDNPFLYCGMAGGNLNIWNLETRQLVRVIKKHSGDLWAINVIGSRAFAGDSNGVVKQFDSRFEQTGCWQAHDGNLLASASGIYQDRQIYVTGGNDNTVAIWDVSGPADASTRRQPFSNDELVNGLAKFVAFKTISSKPEFTGDCNRGAGFLRRLLSFLGASQHQLISTGAESNPIVFARFSANAEKKTGKTILFYGHYDVVETETDLHKWNTEPFQLTSTDGFLYGRGVSDNKGPVLAAVYAAADLSQAKELDSDIVFLIEGEEESGSRGFAKAVQESKNLFGHIDYILLANSYWLDDEIPCLTYGLRGIIHANLTVKSRHPDLHSGIDGSSLLDEPLKDLTLLLASLIGPKGKIKIPNFYDAILPLDKAEESRYAAIVDALLPHHPELANTETFTASLMHRWREPSLTIHTIRVPGSKNTTTISHEASVALSLRIVPNQEAHIIVSELKSYLQSKFAELESENELTIKINRQADPWLGNPDNEIFQALEQAVTKAWAEPSAGTGEYPALTPILRRASSSTQLPTEASQPQLQSLTSTSPPKSPPSSLPTSSTLTRPQPPSPTPTPSTNSTPTTVQQQLPPLKPLYIREGGSIPAIRFLEQEFSAPAAHLPCGQASDHAHLVNERLRVENLYQARKVFRGVFGGLGERK